MRDKKDQGWDVQSRQETAQKGRRRETGSTRGAQTRAGQGARERSTAGFLKDQDPGLFSSEKNGYRCVGVIKLNKVLKHF